MFSALRVSLRSSSARAFSTTPSRASDLSKLVLTGFLTKDPESRLSKNDREYIVYTVSVRSSQQNINGERPPPTFHTILSFNEQANKLLRTLKKGSRVYTEAGFELKEPAQNADPSTREGQRQIMLKHESIRVLSYPKTEVPNTESTSNENSSIEGGSSSFI